MRSATGYWLCGRSSHSRCRACSSPSVFSVFFPSHVWPGSLPEELRKIRPSLSGGAAAQRREIPQGDPELLLRSTAVRQLVPAAFAHLPPASGGVVLLGAAHQVWGRRGPPMGTKHLICHDWAGCLGTHHDSGPRCRCPVGLGEIAPIGRQGFGGGVRQGSGGPASQVQVQAGAWPREGVAKNGSPR